MGKHTLHMRAVHRVSDGKLVAFWCDKCRDYVPWGAATDNERTAVELAAAARAAEWRDENYRPGYDRFEYCPATQSDDLCGQCEALYLAHFIVEPDTTPSGESGERE